MTTIEATMTLGALVTAHPEVAAELDRAGLDYCCDGKRTIASACADRGLDLYTVVSELSRLAVRHPAPAWASMTATQLVDHIEATHHRYLWAELPRLVIAAAALDSTEDHRYAELHSVVSCVETIRSEFEPHLLDEERMLFPRIRELDQHETLPEFHCHTLGGPISGVRREHEHVDEILDLLRKVTHGYRAPSGVDPAWAALYGRLARLDADTHLHSHKENNVLFPLVTRLEERARRHRAAQN